MDSKAEAVVGHPDVWGQFSVCVFVTKLMRNVGEPGMFSADAPCPFDRLLNGGVIGVRLMAECGKHNVIEPLEKREALLGNAADVGEIRCAAEPESIDGKIAVEDGYAREFNSKDILTITERLQMYPCPVGVSCL